MNYFKAHLKEFQEFIPPILRELSAHEMDFSKPVEGEFSKNKKRNRKRTASTTFELIVKLL
jgi:hypothetical protein